MIRRPSSTALAAVLVFIVFPSAANAFFAPPCTCNKVIPAANGSTGGANCQTGATCDPSKLVEDACTVSCLQPFAQPVVSCDQCTFTMSSTCPAGYSCASTALLGKNSYTNCTTLRCPNGYTGSATRSDGTVTRLDSTLTCTSVNNQWKDYAGTSYVDPQLTCAVFGTHPPTTSTSTTSTTSATTTTTMTSTTTTSEANDEKIKLIIDTDGVTDDIRAVSLALSQPNVEVLAITTTHGCVSAKQATANIARTLVANNKHDVPIYQGASWALIKRKLSDYKDIFGEDGLSDQLDAEPPAMREEDVSKYVGNETAALALIRLTKEHPDAVLVCLGPLTNVALALRLDDDFANRPRKLVIMGGNYFGVGNVLVDSSAESNFYEDPEAASAVLAGMNVPITVVPWDGISLHQEENKGIDYYENFRQETLLSKYLNAAFDQPRKFIEKQTNGQLQFTYCDEIAVAMAFAPDQTMQEFKKLRVYVELAGKYSRAQVVVDWFGRVESDDEKEDGNEAEGDADVGKKRLVTFLTSPNVTFVDELILEMVKEQK